MKNWQQIHYVISPTGDVDMYGTKFLPCTNHNGSRFKYCKITSDGYQREKPVTVSWDHRHTGQDNQLNAALGFDHRVLTNYETLLAIKTGYKTKRTVFNALKR